MSLQRAGEEGRLLAVVVLVYIAFYGAFLVATGGLPYVLDNNESFSSLWHAANLHSFGIANGAGLADEAFAFHAAAHPYVHTHQGNFPRVFAYLIYILGARSIEAQIVVTTYTVGLAAMVFAYRFFARVVTPVFGFLACLILITDYMLVAQWQVVTYRVWYAFFVFSSALCVHACAGRTRGWQALTCVNFACLFYFEYIFVAFVTFGVALYAVFILRNPRQVVHFFLWIGAGAAIAIGLLLSQLVLLLGWEDLKRDAYLTFVGRNRYLNDPGVLDEMKEFFSSRNIVFWYNLEDGGRFRRPGFFVASITQYEFQLHTPLLTAVAAILVGGLLAGTLAKPVWQGRQYLAAAALVVGGHMAHKLARGEFGLMQVMPAVGLAAIVVLWVWGTYRVRAAAALTLLLLALPSILDHVSAGDFLSSAYSDLFTAYVILYAGVLAWMLYVVALHRDSSGTFGRLAVVLKYIVLVSAAIFMLAVTLVWDWAFGIATIASEISPSRILLGAGVLVLGLLVAARRVGFSYRLYQQDPQPWLVYALFIFCASVGLFVSWALYDQSYAPLWQDLMARTTPGPFRYLIVYAALLIGAFLATTRTDHFFREHELRGLKRLALFLACAFASYCVVYFLSPGYVFTGYKLRLAPFSVFHTNTLLALAAFILVVLARRPLGEGASVPDLTRSTLRVASAALLALLVWYWGAMQLRYYELMPADNYHFLKRLEEPPYKGKSFIVSNYAAPIAAATGQWAYLHSGLSNNRLVRRGDRYAVELDPTYLWFADKESNPAYRRPDYFICATPPIMWSMNQVVRAQAGLSRAVYGCWENVLVRLAAASAKGAVVPNVRLVEVDADGPSSVGFQRWAIVQLLWDESD